MKEIKYVKTHRNSLPWNGTQSEWYGCTGILSKGFQSPAMIYAHTNPKTQMDVITEQYKRLEKAHNHAQGKVLSNKACAHNIELHKKEILYLTQEIERVRASHELINKSALKIQRVARGYLARKTLENVRQK